MNIFELIYDSLRFNGLHIVLCETAATTIHVCTYFLFVISMGPTEYCDCTVSFSEIRMVVQCLTFFTVFP